MVFVMIEIFKGSVDFLKIKCFNVIVLNNDNDMINNNVNLVFEDINDNY